MCTLAALPWIDLNRQILSCHFYFPNLWPQNSWLIFACNYTHIHWKRCEHSLEWAAKIHSQLATKEIPSTMVKSNKIMLKFSYESESWYFFLIFKCSSDAKHKHLFNFWPQILHLFGSKVSECAKNRKRLTSFDDNHRLTTKNN